MSLFHESYDLLLTPQLPLAAFEAGVEVPREPWAASLARLEPVHLPLQLHGSARTVPCGFTPDGLPAALQLVGARFREDLVLRASRAYEAVHAFRMPRMPCEREPAAPGTVRRARDSGRARLAGVRDVVCIRDATGTAGCLDTPSAPALKSRCDRGTGQGTMAFMPVNRGRGRRRYEARLGALVRRVHVG